MVSFFRFIIFWKLHILSDHDLLPQLKCGTPCSGLLQRSLFSCVCWSLPVCKGFYGVRVSEALLGIAVTVVGSAGPWHMLRHVRRCGASQLPCQPGQEERGERPRGP